MLRSMLRFRAVQNALFSALGVAAVLLGLLAMHSVVTERSTVPETGMVAVTAHQLDTHGVDSAAASVAGAHACDTACMQDMLECALAAIGCAMLLFLAASVLLARRPSLFRALQDAGGRILAIRPPSVPRLALRPDLIVLSVSRT